MNTSKPKFNPNAPFQAVDAKPAFNPNAAFETVDEPVNAQRAPAIGAEAPTQLPAELGSKERLAQVMGKSREQFADIAENENNIQAARQAGAANVVTAGYAPEIVGGLASLAGQDYTQARDATYADSEAIRQKAPGNHLLGSATAAIGGAKALGLGTTGYKQAAKMGTAQGFLSNPGKSAPGDSLQLEERGINGLLGLIMGVGGNALGNLAGKGARIAADTRLVKKPGEAARHVSKYVGDASDKLQKFINGQLGIVDDAVKGKTAKVDLDQYRSMAPELVDEIEQRATKSFRQEPLPGTSVRHFTEEATSIPQPNKQIPGEAGGVFPREPVYETVMVPNPGKIADGIEMIPQRRMVPGSDKVNVPSRPAQSIPQDPISIPGKPVSQPVSPIMQQVPDGYEVEGPDLLTLRRALDDIAGWRTKGVVDPVHMAKSEGAENLANTLRPVLSGMDERVTPANQAVSDTIPLKKVLDTIRSNKDPLSALTTKSNIPTLDLVDETAGTDLLKRSGELKTANELLLDPSNYYKGLSAGMNEVRKYGVRGASELGRSLDKLPKGMKEASLATALEQKRRTK